MSTWLMRERRLAQVKINESIKCCTLCDGLQRECRVIGVMVSFDNGLLDVVNPHGVGYRVDPQQVKHDMIRVAPQAMWPQVQLGGVDGNPVLWMCKTTWA